MTKDNKYRYCFSCDKWLSEKEINEVDLGKQPGDSNSNSSKAYYCSTCKKDTGEAPQIIKCEKHPEIILKVWGTSEGQNKEKIFFKECPKDKQMEKPKPKPTPQPQPKEPLPITPDTPSSGTKGILIAFGIGIVVVIGLVGLWFWYKNKKSKEKEEERL